MKNIFLTFLLGVICFTTYGQTEINCYEKEQCKKLSQDEEECKITKRNTLFKINCDQTVIARIVGNIEDVFYIDSNKNDKSTGRWICIVHSKTGEKLRITIDKKIVIIQSLDYNDLITTYRIKL